MLWWLRAIIITNDEKTHRIWPVQLIGTETMSEHGQVGARYQTWCSAFSLCILNPFINLFIPWKRLLWHATNLRTNKEEDPADRTGWHYKRKASYNIAKKTRTRYLQRCKEEKNFPRVDSCEPVKSFVPSFTRIDKNRCAGSTVRSNQRLVLNQGLLQLRWHNCRESDSTKT